MCIIIRSHIWFWWIWMVEVLPQQCALTAWKNNVTLQNTKHLIYLQGKYCLLHITRMTIGCPFQEWPQPMKCPNFPFSKGTCAISEVASFAFPVGHGNGWSVSETWKQHIWCTVFFLIFFVSVPMWTAVSNHIWYIFLSDIFWNSFACRWPVFSY